MNTTLYLLVSPFLQNLGDNSLLACALVLLVLLTQWVFRKQLTAKWRFLMWWVVLLFLLMPVRPPSSFSLANYFPVKMTIGYDPEFQQLLAQTVPVETWKNQEASRITESSSEQNLSTAPISTEPLRVSDDFGKTPAQNRVSEAKSAPKAAEFSPLIRWFMVRGYLPNGSLVSTNGPIPMLMLVWLTGVIVMTGIVSIQVIVMRRRLLACRGPVSAGVQAVFHDCQQVMRVRRRVELWETEAVQSPALYGAFRLQLLLPQGLSASFSEAELRHIFLHELAHVKRGDMWLNWLVTSLQIFHWFNPFIWLAFARLRTDRELACDELALIHSGETHGQSYGQTILKLLENINQTKPMPGLVGIVEDRKQMAQRLRTIAAFRLPSRWSRLAVLLVLGLALIGLTGAQTPNSTKVNEKQASSPSTQEVIHEVQPSAVTAKPDNTANSPAQILKGRVLLPDGSSAVGAQVGFVVPKGHLFINKNRFETLGSANVSVTDGAGAFDHPLKEECLAVAALHEKGFVQVSMDDFKKNPVLRLQSLGRVEGILRIGDKPGVHQKLFLQSLNHHPQNPDPLLFEGAFTMKTDEEGRFAFDSVPAGEFTIWKTFQASPSNLWPHTVYESSCLGRVIVTLGKTATVSLGGDGVRVIGRAFLHGQPWDWSNTLVSANLNIYPRGADPGSIDSDKARYDYMRSEEFKASMRADRYYTLMVKEDGTVEASDVPPGTYQLRLEARQNLAPPGERYSMAKLKLLASLKKEVVIPELANGKPAVFDLGELVLEREAAQAPAAKPDEKQAAAPEKQPSVIGDAQRFTAGAKADITTNAPHQILRGKVLDAVTRQPVTNFTVRKMEMTRPGPDNPTNIYVHAENGSFQIPLDAASKRVRVSFLFPGYEVAQLTLGTNEMAKEQAILMKPATDYKGRVLLPDGKPARVAQVAFVNATNQPRLGKHQFDTSMGQLVALADMDGEFDHPQIADCQMVAAIHESGFIQIPIEEFRKNPILRLQPWGKVEGVLRRADKPWSGEEIALNPLSDFGSVAFSPSAFKVQTDAEGRFAFDYVPAGEFSLAREFRASPTNSWTRYFLDVSHKTNVIVEPGKKTVVTLGENGVPVTGRVSLNGHPWDWATTRLFAKLEMNPIIINLPEMRVANQGGMAAYEKAVKNYFRSEDYLRAARAYRVYSITVKEDGTLEVWDVPPGKYQLTMEAKQNFVPRGEQVSPSRLKLLATLKKEIVIPEPTNGKPAVFDLGDLILLPSGSE